MSVRLSLRDLVAEFVLASAKRHVGVDLLSGEFVLLAGREEAHGATAERVDRGELLPLPTHKTIGMVTLARRFAESRPDPDDREALLWSLRGRGGLHCFQDTLRRLECAADWEQTRDRHLAEIAVTWMERHDLPYTRDLAPWGRLRRLS